MKKQIKQIGAIFLTLTFLFSAGCSSNSGKISAGIAEDVSNQISPDASKPISSETKPDPKNDTQIGLKNIKLDTKERKLTDTEKAVITYFDNDYLVVWNAETLRRYPALFNNAQIQVQGIVHKVVKMDDESYQLLLWLGSDPYFYPEATASEYIIVNGKTDPSSWLMEGDFIQVLGRCSEVETIQVDGTSYTLPVLNAYNAYYVSTTRTQFLLAERFDYSLIKQVAEAIFGKDIEIREPIAGEDLSMDEAMTDYYALGYAPYPDMDPSEITEYTDLLVELEDQSNANFKKFRFSKYEGSIVDAKGPFDAGIVRKIEFSADFEHFFLFTHNEELESLKLAYYDKSFNKIWEREFSETSNAVYDYTEANLYIVVNNELYIISIATGEDVFDPSYVGEKKEIRKDADGVVIVSASKSDGLMKTSPSGEILWKTNLSADVGYVDGIQFVNGNIILDYSDPDWGQHYCLFDGRTGELIMETQDM